MLLIVGRAVELPIVVKQRDLGLGLRAIHLNVRRRIDDMVLPPRRPLEPRMFLDRHLV